MEPARPLVDESALLIVREKGPEPPLDRETKEKLISRLLSRRFTVNGEQRTLFDLAAQTAVSLAGVFKGERRKMFIPEL
jgi:hypothetical protein